ncbi:MAG: hypothetical protein FJZ09_06995 [Candidatus Omnitrophica bacterium]|nr:hypothetical protein [Candidatus Omnitrophota bacterium]
MKEDKIRDFFWKVLLVLIFLRPFISEQAFMAAGFWFVLFLTFFSAVFLFLFAGGGLFKGALNLGVGLFITAVLASIVFSGATPFSLYEFYLFIPNFCLFFVASRLTHRQRRELFSAIILAAVLIGFYALYQYFFGLRHTLEYIKRTQANLYAEEFLGRMRIFATFISPNILASYIVMALFIILGSFVSYARREKIISIFCMAVMMLALILTKSFGGILTFTCAFAVFIFLRLFYLLPKPGFSKRVLRRIGIGLVLVLSGFILVSGLVMRQRLAELLTPQNTNNSLRQRLYYWQASLKMAREHPIAGVGWRKFGLWYRTYKAPEANVSHYAHNLYLQMLAETGIPGFLSFLALVFLFFRRGLALVRESGPEQGFRIGLFCAGTAFLLHNLFELSFYFGQASFLWWIILGVFA